MNENERVALATLQIIVVVLLILIVSFFSSCSSSYVDRRAFANPREAASWCDEGWHSACLIYRQQLAEGAVH